MILGNKACLIFIKIQTDSQFNINDGCQAPQLRKTHDANFSMWTLGYHQLGMVKLKNQCTSYHTNFFRLALSSVFSLDLPCNKTTLYAVRRITNFYVFSRYGSEYTNLKYKISLAKYVFKVFPMIYWQSE